MNKKVRVSASILCADFTRLGEEIKLCEQSGADMIHVDVMDGQFVPNISIGQVIVEAIRPLTKLPIETHLMIADPGAYLESFAQSGADILSIHVECYGNLREHCRGKGKFPKEVDSVDVAHLRNDINKIKKLGKKVFLVMNPGTPVCFESVLPEVDGVLVMSVNPGFAKQKFMTEVIKKIEKIRSVFAGDIAIDGGVNAETAPLAVQAGANILVTASYLFGAKDRSQAIQSLQRLGA